MSAILNTAPTSPAYNGNDIWVEVGTDLQMASAGQITITFSSTGPSIGETLQIEWLANDITFTVAATTNITATAIPTKGAESLDEYAERVADAFRENYFMTERWDITTSPGGIVQLISRTTGLMVITITENLANTAFSGTDGADIEEENLSSQIEVWLQGAGHWLAKLHGTYDTNTAAVKFNLSELFAVKPHLPNPDHIDPAIFSTWLKGEATDAYAEYYLRYADKYGTPPVPEALVKSDNNYFVIHGAHSADREAATGISFYVDRLHNYRTDDGSTFWKPIGDGQPDWLYIWTKVALYDCNVEWTILWDDGTETVEPYGGTDFDLDASKAYYIRSTPLNFDFTPTNPGAIPWYITFRLFGADSYESDPATLATIRYKAVIETEWERWLLFDNGLGGCEAVLFNGKGKESFSAKREVARRTRTSTFDIDEGEFIQFNAEGQKEYDLNTGWIEPWYAEHLRQLLLGDVWIVDFDNERFIKLICDTDSVVTSENDQQLFALSIKFRTAWVDKASNV